MKRALWILAIDSAKNLVNVDVDTRDNDLTVTAGAASPRTR